MTRYASVLGLGFGDCGKGLFVDALTRRWGAHTVVRFSGGAQAGHNVVAPANSPASGLHHTFSQFGAGTLVPGTRTVLLDPMVVHPTALLTEAACLASKGIDDALPRLAIDGRCRVTTPYHQAAGRLRELLRGARAHGTCGVGVGETVRQALACPEGVLRYAHLAVDSASTRRDRIDRLQAIRKALHGELTSGLPPNLPTTMEAELKVLGDEGIAERWLAAAALLARQCPPASTSAIRDLLSQPGCVLFEGAQGILLDEWRGFHPHTTWSSVTTDAVESAAAAVGLKVTMEHYGAIRTYMTRHGHGPLPTHDPQLAQRLPEPHNANDGWQGGFRRGYPDAVLLRYAIEAVGRLSGLMISHLDVFSRGAALKWCSRYELPHDNGGGRPLHRLPLGALGDLDHQQWLNHQISTARAHYDRDPVTTEGTFLDKLAQVTSLPAQARGYGPSRAEVSD